jgi:steroid delta-isomerase-like uncharacterized protein
MTVEEHKAVVRRYYEEVLNQGNMEVLEELATAEYVEHSPLPGQTSGLAGLRQRVGILRNAFRPHFTIDDLIAEQDKVVVRWTNRGTHQGEFLGMPATGKSFTISGIDIHMLRGGKMAEHWDMVDQLGLLQQLGLIPQPDSIGA